MKVKKIQDFLFLLLVFLIPSNLAYHFILPSSYKQGILVDYLIPAIYLSDLLIITFLGLQFVKNISLVRVYIKTVIFILAFACFVLINTAGAENKTACIYKWVKITEFALLFYYIKRFINIKKNINSIAVVLSLSVLWQSALSICQWIKQANVFPYFVFGESQYSALTPMVKTVSLFGFEKAVPMGTFPHPNVLAGFLVLSLLFLLRYRLNMQENDKNTNKNKRVADLLLITSIVLGMVALALTFSVISWSVFGFVLTAVLLNKFKIKWQGKVMVLGLVLVLCSQGLQLVEASSYIRREKLNEIALKMWTSSPWVGVGLNNFTVRMNEFGEIVGNIRFLQPVHNIFLLTLAETGIIGLLVLTLVVGYLIRKRKWICTGTIITLGLFDHYFLTLQEGMLMAVVFATIYNKIKKDV